MPEPASDGQVLECRGGHRRRGPVGGIDHESEPGQGPSVEASNHGVDMVAGRGLVLVDDGGDGGRFPIRSEEGLEPLLDVVLPRIVDNFQVYLRELRIEDLQGSAGLQRLREELLLRVNASTKTAKVRDVLFKEMLVQ